MNLFVGGQGSYRSHRNESKMVGNKSPHHPYKILITIRNLRQSVVLITIRNIRQSVVLSTEP